MRRATFVVTMMLLLGSASVATAECAWVLWNRSSELSAGVGSVSTLWVILDAFEDRMACVPERDRGWKREVKKYRNSGSYKRVQDQPEDNGFFYLASTGEKGSVRFVCLPDTLDPREKKGD